MSKTKSLLQVILIIMFCNSVESQNNKPAVIVEGIDSAFLKVKSFGQLFNGNSISAINFLNSSDKNEFPATWSMLADGSTSKFNINRNIASKKFKFMTVTWDKKFGFGTSDLIADFEFAGLSGELQINSKADEYLSFKSGVYSSINTKIFDSFKLGTDSIIQLNITDFGTFSEGALITEKGLRIYKDFDFLPKWEIQPFWDISMGPSLCGVHFNNALTFSNTTSGLAATIRASDGEFCNTSDIRYKKNIFPLSNILESVMKLRPVSFRYRHQDNDADLQIGFIAQEVMKIFPELIKYDQNLDLFTMNYTPLSVIAIETIKSQNLILDSIEERIKNMENELNLQLN